MALKTFIVLFILIADPLFIVHQVGGAEGYYEISGQLTCKRDAKTVANLELEFHELDGLNWDDFSGKTTTNGSGHFHFRGKAEDGGFIEGSGGIEPYIYVILFVKIFSIGSHIILGKTTV